MPEEQRVHPASCPCSECKKMIEEATKSLGEDSLNLLDNPSLRKISPEAANVFGYIHPKN